MLHRGGVQNLKHIEHKGLAGIIKYRIYCISPPLTHSLLASGSQPTYRVTSIDVMHNLSWTLPRHLLIMIRVHRVSPAG